MPVAGVDRACLYFLTATILPFFSLCLRIRIDVTAVLLTGPFNVNSNIQTKVPISPHSQNADKSKMVQPIRNFTANQNISRTNQINDLLQIMHCFIIFKYSF